jgi:tetratricopeptide (TPR) repeat protein
MMRTRARTLELLHGTMLATALLLPLANSQTPSHDASFQTALQQLDQGASTLDAATLTRARDKFQQLSAGKSPDARAVFELARADYYLASYYELIAKNRSAFSQEVDAAIRNAERAVKLEPGDSNAHALLGDLYGRKIGLGGIFTGMKYGPKGEDEMNQAVKLDPRNPYAYACLGRRYLFTPRIFGGDLQKAVENFKKAVALDPKYSEGFVWLGIAYRVQGNRVLAGQNFREALKLDPQNAQARLQIAGMSLAE